MAVNLMMTVVPQKFYNIMLLMLILIKAALPEVKKQRLNCRCCQFDLLVPLYLYVKMIHHWRSENRVRFSEQVPNFSLKNCTTNGFCKSFELNNHNHLLVSFSIPKLVSTTK